MAAFIVRAVVAWELGDTVLYRRPQLDALEFLRWARQIADSGFQWPRYPTHGPVYPLLLALLLRLFDGSFLAVRLAQAGLGAITCALTAGLTARFWGPVAGLAAGLLLAFQGPAAFVDTAFWEEVVLMPLLVGTLFAFSSPTRSLPLAALSGGLLGTAVLVRPTALALLPVLLILLWRPRWRRPAAAAVTLVLALVVVVAPVVLAVSRSTGTFVFVRGFGAINVLIGSDPEGGGVQNARVGGAWDRLESAPIRAGVEEIGELEGWYLRQAMARLVDRPWAVAGTLLEKAVWVIQAEELRDNHSYAFFEQRSRLLTVLPGFGFLLALAAAGVLAAARRRQVPWVLVGYLGAMVLTVLVALVGLRYRLPLVPGVAAFAGLGVAVLWAAARRRQPREVIAPLVVVAAVWLLSHAWNHPQTRNFSEEWVFTGASLLGERDLTAAAAAFRRSLEHDPSYGLAWDGLGQIALRRGQSDEAREAFERAVAADPNLVRGHHHLGVALERQGDPAAAAAAYARAVEIAPRHLPSLLGLARLALDAGDLRVAETVWRRIHEVQPDHPDAALSLARLAGATGRADEGLSWAREAVRRRPADGQAWLVYGGLAAEAGDAAALREATPRVDVLVGPAPAALLEASAARLAGDRERADRILRRLLQSEPAFEPAIRLFLLNARELGREPQARTWLGSR